MLNDSARAKRQRNPQQRAAAAAEKLRHELQDVERLLLQWSAPPTPRAEGVAGDPRRHAWRDLVLSIVGPNDSGARLVGVAVVRFVDWFSFESFVSAERLAMAAGMSERATRTNLQSLQESGWLSRRDAGGGRPRVLVLAVPETCRRKFEDLKATATVSVTIGCNRSTATEVTAVTSAPLSTMATATTCSGDGNPGMVRRQLRAEVTAIAATYHGSSSHTDHELNPGALARAIPTGSHGAFRSKRDQAPPPEPIAERIRKARALLQVQPDQPPNSLKRMFRLSDEQLAEVQAP